MGTPMKSSLAAFRQLAISITLFFFAITPSMAEEGNRSCSVKEVLKGGIYVYLRCQENDKDIWLATVAREFKTDEVISFVNAPPMTDFYSKFLNRTFSEVILTDILPPEGKKK
jgi:hypothetical protein